MNEVLAESTARARFHTMLFTVFALLGLLLACTGVYGTLAYLVEQRTREIGVRMAVGAGSADVAKLLFTSAARMVGPGLAAGTLIAFALAKYMDSVIFGMATFDATVFGIVMALMSAVALLAGCIPARRALRVDPAISLRC